MNILNETRFEEHIATCLAKSDLYNQRKASDFDIENLCDWEMLERFLRAQTKSWKRLGEMVGEDKITAMVVKECNRYIDRDGILSLLHKGITIMGVRLKVVQFKPAHVDEEDVFYQLYKENRFSVVRQMKYSKREADKMNELDLCLLINGLPIVTCELKNEGTGQNFTHGIAQYRYNRDGKNRMLRNCLVHFVMDNNYVFMTTKLNGEETRFLPFNRDSVNPPIAGEYPTAYMWQRIWQADSMLDILQNFVKQVKDKNHNTSIIFPRYHQLRAVRKLRTMVNEEGAGHNYLIQHSAGSGKTKSMAWLAHQLINMVDKDNCPIFDCVVMVTDRIVLNRNMADEVLSFEEVKGTVKDIRRGSKKLAEALDEGNKIIISTVQKFAFALPYLKRETSRKYAIIIDEAHTAVGNESAKDIVSALTTDEELQSVEGFNAEDYDSELDALMAYQQAMRKKMGHLSYFAFTATPKDKTFALYGTKDGKAHDLYSMKQAIDEKFILDVLKNYKSYATMFELVEKEGLSEDAEKFFEEKKTLKLIYQNLNKNQYIMLRKATMIVDHFMAHTGKKIGCKAKAMLVCDSRQMVAEYKQVIDKVIATNYNGAIKTLVAFSGEVEDLHGRRWTESSMNDDGVTDEHIAEKFEEDNYKILIVADKFQTGFDQPLLHTMYVDKMLGGIQCIQTLSRLNRCYPGKEDTMVVDFRNDVEDVQEAFQKYYTETMLEGEIDQSRMYVCKNDVEAFKVFSSEEVDKVVECLTITNQLSAVPSIMKNIVDERVLTMEEGDRDVYRKTVNRYVRQYGFFAQLMDFIDPELEKFYVFCKVLYVYLPYTKETLPMEVLDMIDLNKLRIQMSYDGSLTLKDETMVLESSRIGDPTKQRPDEKKPLKEILDVVNSTYANILDENDEVVRQIWIRLMEDPEVNDTFKANNNFEDLIEFVRMKFDDAIADQMGKYYDFAKVLEKEQGFTMMLMRKFVETLAAQTSAEYELSYDEDALKVRMNEEFKEEFEPLKNEMRALSESVDYMFKVLNAKSVPNLDGINDLVKDTLNQIYRSNKLRYIDRRRHFNQLVTKYEAYLKKLYYLINSMEIEPLPEQQDVSLKGALKAFPCLWDLKYNTDERYKKFYGYLQMLKQYRNDESHGAPVASEEEIMEITMKVVAMYIFVTSKSVTDLEVKGY